MINTRYCNHCKLTTTHFKDMCMKCSKKSGLSSKEATDILDDLKNTNAEDLFGGLFKRNK